MSAGAHPEVPPKLLRGVVQVFSPAELEKKLAKGQPLRVKLGVDPTSPDLHLGHTVALNKLRQFQDAGHRVVFIIGDFTAAIGDPSGRQAIRPVLSTEEIKKNSRTYLDQVFQVLNRSLTEVKYNSDWLTPLFEGAGILQLMRQHTIQQLLEREDFKARQKNGEPISLLEVLYPLLQGYDSVAVKADVEVGGTDQLFNLLMGRELQTAAGQAPQVVITLPLLEGTDGVKKMSKSHGNSVDLNDSAKDMFGKLMALPDALMWKYFELLTDVDAVPLKSAHPMEAKYRLAEIVTTRFHSAAAAAEAKEAFQRVFSRREAPRDMAEHRAKASVARLLDLLCDSGLAPSRNEARRLIQQGAVEVDGVVFNADAELPVEKPLVIKVGKRQFRKIIPSTPGGKK